MSPWTISTFWRQEDGYVLVLESKVSKIQRHCWDPRVCRILDVYVCVVNRFSGKAGIPIIVEEMGTNELRRGRIPLDAKFRGSDEVMAHVVLES